MKRTRDGVVALLEAQERAGIVELVRDDDDGRVLGWTTPYQPSPPKQRGRGRYPAPHPFRDPLIRERFAQLVREGQHDFRQVPGKPNRASIRRALAQEFGLSVEQIKKIENGS